MSTPADPKVDYAFKHVFGREQSEAALISLLDAVLQPAPGQNITSVELLNPFNDKEALDDKLSILDIKARDQSGRQFNVEMQMLAYGAFRQRALYYWSRLYQAQLQEGEDYRVLRPTISVCFVDTPLFPDVTGYHRTFELRERHHHTLFTDQMAVHILELAKFDKGVAELTTPLDRWLFFLKYAEELEVDALPEALNTPELRWALGDLMMISQSEHDRELYESRLKMRRDVSTALAEAKETGHAEGWEKGWKDGMEKGMEKGMEMGMGMEEGMEMGMEMGMEEGMEKGMEHGMARGMEKGMEMGRIAAQIQRIHSLQRLLRQEITSRDHLEARSSSDLEHLVAGLENELSARLSNSS